MMKEVVFYLNGWVSAEASWGWLLSMGLRQSRNSDVEKGAGGEVS